MSTKGSLSKLAKPRSNMRGLRTALQRYVVAGVFLGLYLLCTVYFLNDIEAPGHDDNIVLMLLGAVIVTALGAWVAPLVPLLMTGAGSKANKSLSRPRNRQSNK